MKASQSIEATSSSQPEEAKVNISVADLLQMIACNRLADEGIKWLQSRDGSAVQARQSLFEHIMTLTSSDFAKFEDYTNLFLQLENIFKNDNEHKTEFRSRTLSDPLYSLAVPSTKPSMLKEIQDKKAAVIQLVTNSMTELANLSAKQVIFDEEEERKIEEENAARAHAESKLLTADELNQQPIQFVYELLTNKESKIKIPINVQDQLRYAYGFCQKLCDHIDSRCINFSSIEEVSSLKEIVSEMKDHRIFGICERVVAHPMGGAYKYDVNKEYREKLAVLETLLETKIKYLQAMQAPQKASVTKAPLKFLFTTNGKKEVDADHAENVRKSSLL